MRVLRLQPLASITVATILGVAACTLDASGTGNARGTTTGATGGAGGQEPPRCDDGQKNGTETDTDCGGACPVCNYGRACLSDQDCAGRCVQSLCQPIPFGRWRLREAGTPPGRHLFAMAFQGNTQTTLLFGGINGVMFQADTWTWDGMTWTNWPIVGPTGRYGHSMAYDEKHQQTILYGGVTTGYLIVGDMWLFDGTQWTASNQGPLSRAHAVMAYDRARENILMFGGATNIAVLDETWSWDGMAWTQLTPNTKPPARQLAAMTYDTARQRIVMFGGVGTGNIALSDTWEWDGSEWTERLSTERPSPRFGHVMAYHEQLKRVVLFGGTNQQGIFGDTWEYDGEQWASAPAGGPVGHYYGGMVYDNVRHRITTHSGHTGFPYPSETYDYNAVATTCSKAADCGGEGCVDGLCCTLAACGSCQACNTLDSPGFCHQLLAQDDPDSCTGPFTCDNLGICVSK